MEEEINQFEINLDKFVYYPGQSINGTLKLEFVKNIRIRADVRKETSTVFAASTEYKFPFHFVLPEYLPCSFESRWAYIRYYITVSLDIPFSSPAEERKYLTVIGPPFETDERYFNSVTQEKYRYLWNFCGIKRNRIHLQVSFDRYAYCCGESLKFKTKIVNRSNRNIYLAIQLNQQVQYTAGDKTKSITHKVFRHKTPKISPDAVVNITSCSFKIFIPVVPPTLERICRLVEITYILMFGLEIEDSTEDFCLDFPIVIVSSPIQYHNAPTPKLYYDYCIKKVEGGNYLPPEFMVGQVYDGTGSVTGNSFHNTTPPGPGKSLSPSPPSTSNNAHHVAKSLTTPVDPNHLLLSRKTGSAKSATPQTSLDDKQQIIFRPMYATLICPASLLPKKSILIFPEFPLPPSPFVSDVEKRKSRIQNAKKLLMNGGYSLDSEEYV